MSSSAPKSVDNDIGTAQDAEFAADLRLAATGDDDAIGRLVAEFRPGLVQSARRRHSQDPDGVANTAMYDTLRGLPRFRGTDRRAFRAYLYQVLDRRLVDEFRRSNGRGKQVPLDPAGDVLSGVTDPGASVFDERVADRHMVAGMLETLTDDQREVVELRLMDGMSIKETAAKTGRSEVAVKAMQRRALNALRATLVAVAVAAIAVGLWALQRGGDGLTVVDNDPAGVEDDGSSPDSGTDEQSSGPDAETGADRVVVEASVPDDDEAVDEPASASSPAGANVDGLPTTTEPGSGSTVSSTATVADPTSTTVTDAESAFRIAALPRAQTDSPCTVVTDGTPERGEVAFVTFDMSGPYYMFRGTTIDVVGQDGASALLPGKFEPTDVGASRTFPFVLNGNMFWPAGLAVTTTLADGAIRARCLIDDEALVPPCAVRLTGTEPEVGATAIVRYRAQGPYQTLVGQPTEVVTRGGRSAMVGGVEPTLVAGDEHRFTIAEDMLRTGALEVRTAFADGRARAICEIR